MKKFLLFILLLVSILSQGQVANPEPTYTPLPQTGFTATADSWQDANRDASKTVDGNNATYWETKWNPSPATPLPHWLQVDMGSAQTIHGVYITDRANQGNSIKTCTVSTSTDGVSWTQQGGTFTLPYDASQNKIHLKFADPVECRYYRIDVSANQTTTNQVTNVAETGALTITITDNTAYNRANWSVTASSQSSAATSVLDQNTATFWQSVWQPVPAPYPHTLVFDMKESLPVNQVYYHPRNHLNSSATAGSLAFSDDGTNFGDEIPVTFSSGFKKQFINLSSLQTHRYFRITYTQNVYARDNPNDISNSAYYATSVAEVGTAYNTSLSATLLSLQAAAEETGIKISWSTAFEVNTAGYTIYRSTDGLQFEPAGQVAASTNTDAVTNYSFTDVSPAPGTYFYKIERNLTNGNKESSHVVNGSYPLIPFTSDKPKNLNVVYFIPSDIAACPGFEERISKILLSMQDYYGKEMERNGRGYKTFGLLKNNQAQRVKLIIINGKFSHFSYPYTGGGGAVQSEIDAYKASHPEEFSGSHYLVIIPAYSYSENGEPSGGPFYGTGKYCYALDYPDMKQELLGTGGTLGDRAVKWIGGMAHELGHGLNLPHNHTRKTQIPTVGTLLMGAGNFTYGKALTSLSEADCAALNNNEVFNDGSINYYGAANSSMTSLNGFYSPEKNAIILSGRVAATGSPVTDVSFYHDANFKNSNGTYNGIGGNKDYDAVTWNTPIIGTDSFYIEMGVEDFNYSDSLLYQLRLRRVLQNGNIHTNSYDYHFINNIPVINFGKKQWINRNDWVVLANSEDAANPDEHMIDKSNATAWTPLTPQNGGSSGGLYDIKVDMTRDIALAGVTITNAQGNLSDAPRNVDVEVSNDGISWSPAISGYELPKSIGPNNISFNQFATARYFRLKINTTWGGATINPAIAEINAFTNLLNKAPEFTTPADTILYKDNTCQYDSSASSTGRPTAVYDDYDENPTTTYTDEVITGPNEEMIITRKWKLADNMGLLTEQVQLITVKDTTAPVITGVTDIVFCHDAGGNYTIAAVSVVENCEMSALAYQVTGATQRNGSGADASGSFNPGVSVIEWMATDKSGNSTVFQTTVTVHPSLVASIPDVYAVNPGGVINTIYIGYGPSSIVLSPVVSGGVPSYTYSWSNGTATANNTVSPSAAGLYSYTATITDAAGCVATATTNINVIDIRAGNGIVYVCHKGKVTTPVKTADVPDHIKHGDILGSCGNGMITQRGTAIPELADNREEFSVKVYPNPASVEFNLDIRGDDSIPVVVKAFDLQGKLIKTIKTTVGIINAGEEWKPGIYLVEVKQGEKRKVVKLVKL